MTKPKSPYTFQTTLAGNQNKPIFNAISLNSFIIKPFSSMWIGGTSQAFTTLKHIFFSDFYFDIQLIYRFSFENSCLCYKTNKAEFDDFRTAISYIQVIYSDYKGVAG